MKLVKKTAVLKAVILGLMALPQLSFAGRFGMTGGGGQEEIQYDILCKGNNPTTGINYRHYINTRKGEAYLEQSTSRGIMLLAKYHDVRCQGETCIGTNNHRNDPGLDLNIRDCEITAEKSKIVNLYGAWNY